MGRGAARSAPWSEGPAASAGAPSSRRWRPRCPPLSRTGLSEAPRPSPSCSRPSSPPGSGSCSSTTTGS
eukprot:8048007-Lingulodinium_polyedra.AAC.1